MEKGARDVVEGIWAGFGERRLLQAGLVDRVVAGFAIGERHRIADPRLQAGILRQDIFELDPLGINCHSPAA
jgi:hypothetical protein